ncbi:PREDICTED: uncharacterized protein LOC105557454 [Vollenhovia emeryi]|uniref:uncharacterized protein LOC105557454 n=1 Tax=Vollenhovia emeryi TaxID=411798 RepID=UPI0005F361E0|nr:PREDICTED: uncharacterized protein LOC105557454 [Vollenhovia emeryi]
MLSCEGSNEEDPLFVPSSVMEEAAASGDIGHLPGISFGVVDGSMKLVADASAKRKRDSSESPGAVSVAAASSDSEPAARGPRACPRAISDDSPFEGGSGDCPVGGVIVLSSEECPTADGFPPERKNRKRRQKKKKQKKDGNSTRPEPELRPDLGSPGSEVLKQVMKSEEALASCSAAEIASMARAWLGGIENARKTSQNIKGTLSGQMGKRIKALQNVIAVFSERVEDAGDVPFLQRKKDELEEQLKKAKKSEDQLKKELEESRERTSKLSAELSALRERIGSKSTSREDNVATASAKERSSVAVRGPRAPRKHGTRSRVLAEASASTDVGEPAMDISKRLEGYEVTLTNEIGNLMHIQSDIAALKKRVLNDDPPPSPPPWKRGIPRIVGDVQIRPPLRVRRAALDTDSEVVVSSDGRDLVSYRDVALRQKDKGRGGSSLTGGAAPRSHVVNRIVRKEDGHTGPRTNGPRMNNQKRDGPQRRRVPRSAAVALRSATEGRPHAELLKKARQEICIGDLGIVRPRIRMAANGGYLIEIPGEDSSAKADALAEKLRDFLGSDAVVTRPMAKGELRVSGMDSSVIPDELRAALIDAGGCTPGDIRIGAFRRSPGGLCSAWVQCPLGAANRLATAGSCSVGWTTAKITFLKKRPVQCYRCWDFGHVRGGCRSTTDRGGACFNCGKEGHTLRECASNPCCIVCREKGLNADHRLGTTNCPSAQPRDRRADPKTAG